jgi:hypothetical protein
MIALWCTCFVLVQITTQLWACFFVTLLIGSAVGVVVFEVCALALGLPEARTVPAAFLRRIRR